MTPHAAAGTLLVAALLFVTFCYAVTCLVFPFRPCRRCDGTGRVRLALGRSVRLCRRCDGTGLRLRLGRRLWNLARRTHRDANR